MIAGAKRARGEWAGPWIVLAALFLAAFFFVGEQRARGQAGALGSDPKATATQGQPPRITVRTLIGDAVGDPESPQYKEVADALTRAMNRDLAGARDMLESAKKKNPNLPPADLIMAKMFAAAGQGPAARAELERAVVNDPNDPEAYLLFAQLALQERHFTEAELLLLKGKSLAETYKENSKRKRNFEISIASGLAIVAEAREQWDTAIEQLRKWLEIDPDSVAAHQRLGIDLFRQGKGSQKSAQEAYKEFQAAMKIDSKANAEIMLAELYQTTGEVENAKRWIDYAVKKNPNDLRVQLGAASLSLKGDRLNDAQTHADVALKIDPDSADAKMMRAYVARLEGDLKMAESLLEQVHLESPSNLAVANMLAQVLVDQSDANKQRRGLELARMSFSATSQGNRLNRDMLATLGWALFRNGQTAEAERALMQLVASGALSPDYAYYVAKGLLEAKEQYRQAISVLEAALKSPGPFAYRLAASGLVSELKKKPQSSEPSTPTIVPDVTPAPEVVPDVTPNSSPVPTTPEPSGQQ